MLEVKEMNANILIAIHNVAQYDKLFAMIRDNISRVEPFIEKYITLNCVDRQ